MFAVCRGGALHSDYLTEIIQTWPRNKGKDLFVCNYVLGFYSAQHLMRRGLGSLSEILGAMKIGI